MRTVLLIAIVTFALSGCKEKVDRVSKKGTVDAGTARSVRSKPAERPTLPSSFVPGEPIEAKPNLDKNPHPNLPGHYKPTAEEASATEVARKAHFETYKNPPKPKKKKDPPPPKSYDEFYDENHYKKHGGAREK